MPANPKDKSGPSIPPLQAIPPCTVPEERPRRSRQFIDTAGDARFHSDASSNAESGPATRLMQNVRRSLRLNKAIHLQLDVASSTNQQHPASLSPTEAEPGQSVLTAAVIRHLSGRPLESSRPLRAKKDVEFECEQEIEAGPSTNRYNSNNNNNVIYYYNNNNISSNNVNSD